MSGGSWATGTPLPSRRAENAAAVIDGVIYLPGGLDANGNSLTTFEAFDTTAGTWKTLALLPEQRDHFGLAAFGGKLYLTGGSIFYTAAIRESTWVYDPATDKWTALAPMPGPRSQHGSAVVGDRIYVVGGVVRGPDSRALWAYDPASGDWHMDLAPMPTEREHLSVVEAGGRAHRARWSEGAEPGGRGVVRPRARTPGPRSPTCRRRAAAWPRGVIDGVIHLAGGENLNAMSDLPATRGARPRHDRPGRAARPADEAPRPRRRRRRRPLVRDRRRTAGDAVGLRHRRGLHALTVRPRRAWPRAASAPSGATPSAGAIRAPSNSTPVRSTVTQPNWPT